MPPVFRYAWRHKSQINWTPIGAIPYAIPGGHKAGLIWRRKSYQSPHAGTRRSLFELYAGRESPHLPYDLPLGELSEPEPSDEDDHHWFISSDDLIDALGHRGLAYARPKEYARLVDHCYVDPLLAAYDRKVAIEKAEKTREVQRVLKENGRHGKSRKQILIDYIRHVDPHVRLEAHSNSPISVNMLLDDGLCRVFDKSTLRWLNSRDLDVTDVVEWAWVVGADTIERAALRLMLLVGPPVDDKQNSKKVPQFLLNFLLRHNFIDARSLQSLLDCTCKMLRESESPVFELPTGGSSSPSIAPSPRDIKTLIRDARDGMSQRTFVTIIVRLLRSARKVWPPACETIVSLFTTYLDGIHFRKDIPNITSPCSGIQIPAKGLVEITHIYNTMLRLLSIPSFLHPFQNAVHLQRAQFRIVRRMSEFDPPLVVDRKGHQAIVRMQLMHSKTPKERRWACLQAPSWPPYKKDKTGMDAAIGVQDGFSRAKQVLNKSQEAGYSPDGWDLVAGIHSGWDTDGSPTIQTRSIVSYPPDVSPWYRREAIAAARIRATRTLDEAWSSFSAWQREIGKANTGQPAYLAMFTKIMYSLRDTPCESRTLTTDALSTQNLPGNKPALALGVSAGDGPKPRPVPGLHGVHVRRSPPNAEEFLGMMIDDGIKPSGQLLAFLLANAPSFTFGLRCLGPSELEPLHLEALFTGNLTNRPEFRVALESIPKQLFASLIRFLTQFAPTMSDQGDVDPYALVYTGLTLRTDAWSHALGPKAPKLPADKFPFNSLARTHQLLLALKPRYRPAWYHLFRALSRRKSVTGLQSRRVNQDSQDILTWRILHSLLDEMQAINLYVDFDGFKIICTGLEKGILANERVKARSHLSVSEFDVSQELSFVKQLFISIVGKPSWNQMKERHLQPADLMPTSLEVPNPAHLHAYIRVLGLSRDYHGILELVEWMFRYADDIDTLVEEAANGKRMIRMCMIAVCVFLERGPAPLEVMEKVKNLVDVERRWDGWPGMEDLEEYSFRRHGAWERRQAVHEYRLKERFL